MKFAFDCKGTLLSKSNQSRRLLKDLYDLGHDITIWSNLYSYAIEAKELFPDLDRIEVTTKYTNSSIDTAVDPEELIFDYAIDDEDQYYLATKELIYVHSIPTEEEDYKKFLNDLVTGNVRGLRDRDN